MLRKSFATDIVQAIDDAYERRKRGGARTYIGASAIGHPCDAMLAFSLRGYPETPPEPKLQRIFQVGHKLEDMVVKDLRQAGLHVIEKDPVTGKQHHCELLGGHIATNMDGHIEDQDGDVAVLEIKTMNDANFAKFRDGGVRYSHPRYYAQVQMMMGMSGIQQALFIATNKNTCAYHAEVVDFDEFEWAHQRTRIEKVLSNQARKVSKDESDWRCKGCFKRGVCWHGDPVPASCTTCTHALATKDGGWWCGKHSRKATALCDDYELYHPLPKE